MEHFQRIRYIMLNNSVCMVKATVYKAYTVLRAGSLFIRRPAWRQIFICPSSRFVCRRLLSSFLLLSINFYNVQQLITFSSSSHFPSSNIHRYCHRLLVQYPIHFIYPCVTISNISLLLSLVPCHHFICPCNIFHYPPPAHHSNASNLVTLKSVPPLTFVNLLFSPKPTLLLSRRVFLFNAFLWTLLPSLSLSCQAPYISVSLYYLIF